MELDPLDRKILSILEADGRISFADLAERVGLSKTPCWKRVKALEDAGIIRGYAARLDAGRLGFGVEAFVQASVDFEMSDAFEEAVQKHPMILRCHAMTGEADYLLHVAAMDVVSLDQVLRKEISRLPGVRRTITSVSTREIKGTVSVSDALMHVQGASPRGRM